MLFRSAHGDNKVAITQKMVDTYYMNNGQTIEEAETTGYYVREGFTETANDPQTMNGAPFMGVGLSLIHISLMKFQLKILKAFLY